MGWEGEVREGRSTGRSLFENQFVTIFMGFVGVF